MNIYREGKKIYIIYLILSRDAHTFLSKFSARYTLHSTRYFAFHWIIHINPARIFDVEYAMSLYSCDKPRPMNNASLVHTFNFY